MKPKLLTTAICLVALFFVDLAYAYHPLSPYAYCANNPVNFVDPDGMDYYQSNGGSVIWQDNDKRKITINDEIFNNIGKSYSVQIDEDNYVNYYQNVAVSISSQAVDAGQIVLGNTALAGTLLGRDSPLAAGAQQGLMADLIHQGQSDFINHPVTQTAIGIMSFVATGGIEGTVAVSRILSKNIGSQTIYRVYGGEAQALGRSWTPVNPASVANYRNAAGLPNVNTGRFVIKGSVRKSNILLRRNAIPLDGNTGGVMEYVIKNPNQVKIYGVYGANPPF